MKKIKQEKPKKKISKKAVFFVLLFWVVIIISAGMSSEQEKLQKENKNSSAQSTAPVASAVSSVSSSSAAESTEPDTSVDEAAPVDVPEETPGKAYAAVQSADTSVLDDMGIKVCNVNDDITGNWRMTYVDTKETAEEYAIAYKEVSEILKYIPIFDYEKIPREKIELYKKMQDRDYHFKYNPLKTLDEQNVSKQAKIIIGLLFRDYWATEEQKSKIVAKQNYEREKLIKEQKNLFKYKNRNMKESEIINCEEKFLQEPKDNIFKRIFKRVKCIFKLKN